MAKKVRFPLEMENGVEVRNMEELRENFSLPKVLSYLKEGKLVVWLRDRYVNDIADAVEKLDIQDEELVKKLCEIFEVAYDETTEEELEKAAERAERVRRLKEYTDDKQYEKEIDNVAFDQDELYDLLDEDADTIYLCGERFSIPLAKTGVTYIGINNPVVVIDSYVEVDWGEKDISVENVVFDEKYQAVLDASREEKDANDRHELVESAYEIKSFEIPPELFEKYEINSWYNSADGRKYAIVDALVEKNNPDLDKYIQKNVVDFAEDERKLYILSEGLLPDVQYACSIYDKLTHDIETFPILKDKLPLMGRGLLPTSLSVGPKIRDVSIDTEHILFFGKKAEELKWVNFDGSDERCIFRVVSQYSIDPILIKDGVFYYGKFNRDGKGVLQFDSTFTICSFNVYEGKENIICSAVKSVSYDSLYMYMYEKISEGQYRTRQLDFASEKLKKQTKEELKTCNVKLLDNGALVVWKGDYSTNKQIASYCNAYIQKETDVYYLLPGGTFGKYNFETDEKKIFDILIEDDSPNSHSFTIVDNMVYYKAHARTWDKDYYVKLKRLFVLNLQDDSVQIVPYKFYQGIQNIVNHNDSIFVQEGLTEMNIIYKKKNGEWEQLVENVRAYCFNDNYIYFARDDISRSNYGGYHMFYKLKIETKEEEKIAEVKYDSFDDGFVKKIEISNNKIVYQEDTSSGMKTKEIPI